MEKNTDDAMKTREFSCDYKLQEAQFLATCVYEDDTQWGIQASISTFIVQSRPDQKTERVRAGPVPKINPLCRFGSNVFAQNPLIRAKLAGFEPVQMFVAQNPAKNLISGLNLCPKPTNFGPFQQTGLKLIRSSTV